MAVALCTSVGIELKELRPGETSDASGGLRLADARQNCRCQLGGLVLIQNSPKDDRNKHRPKANGAGSNENTHRY